MSKSSPAVEQAGDASLAARLRRVHLEKMLAFARSVPSYRPDGQGKVVYRRLIASTLEIPDESEPLRRASMFLDGTKVGYSLQIGDQPAIAAPGAGPKFRVLVEPGGVGMTLPEQVDFALATVDGLLDELSWLGLAPAINAIARIAFHVSVAELNDWWGGVWLGCECDGNFVNLRLYFNLRHGDLRTRWQRIADIFRPYAPAAMEDSFRTLVARLVDCGGIPVGLAAVLADGRIAGFRIYVGIEHPTPDSVCAAVPWDGNTRTHLCGRLRSLISVFGPFDFDAVTVGFDFPVGDDGNLGSVARFKADVGCCDYQTNAPDTLAAWLVKDLTEPGLRAHRQFLERLQAAFGGADLNYLSFGYRASGAVERTLYYEPHGIAPIVF